MTTDQLLDDDEAAGASPLAGLAAELDSERAGLARELDEMELLLKQARTEAERHEQRRAQATDKLAQLEQEQGAARPDLSEAREALVVQTRRAALMAGQVQLLESKQKSLRRFEGWLRTAAERMTGLEARTDPDQPAQAAPARALMAAQEEMRREIARQMHDGPAQSIANIALQAEVVQRLMARDPSRAEAELTELGSMVQHALEATKNFIFDVRPMVLDDLGIVPTLRRTARERTQRSGVAIRFESDGADRRLDSELETALYRIVDQALAAYAGTRPDEIVLRLNWTESQLETSVRSRAATDADEPAQPSPAAADAGSLPPALAAMIDDQRERAEASAAARRQARGLPAAAWADVQARAASVGIELRLDDDGRQLMAIVAVPG